MHQASARRHHQILHKEPGTVFIGLNALRMRIRGPRQHPSSRSFISVSNTSFGVLNGNLSFCYSSFLGRLDATHYLQKLRAMAVEHFSDSDLLCQPYSRSECRWNREGALVTTTAANANISRTYRRACGCDSPLSARSASKKRNPRYPVSASRRGKEGWVVLNYMVNLEGSTYEIEATAYAGDRSFFGAAKRAAERYQYGTAHVDGMPIYSGAATRIKFRLSEG